MDTLVAWHRRGMDLQFIQYRLPDFWHQRGIHPHVYYEAAAVVIAFILNLENC